MDKVNYNFSLPVSVIKEGDSFIAYSPALDLSTVGDSFEEAQTRFGEAVQIFFEEITQKGTVEEALTQLGWQKLNSELIPPVVVSNTTQQFSVPNLSLKYA
jgi:hypothetical protein